MFSVIDDLVCRWWCHNFLLIFYICWHWSISWHDPSIVLIIKLSQFCQKGLVKRHTRYFRQEVYVNNCRHFSTKTRSTIRLATNEAVEKNGPPRDCRQIRISKKTLSINNVDSNSEVNKNIRNKVKHFAIIWVPWFRGPHQDQGEKCRQIRLSRGNTRMPNMNIYCFKRCCE